MVVIYAEKHSLAKTIASALNAGKRIPFANDATTAHWDFSFNGEACVIVHGAGHLAGLANASDYDEKFRRWDLDIYPIIPDKFKVIPSKDKTTLIGNIGKYFEKADWLINATDPDREGELIFAYILDHLKINKPWKRVILSDLTENTISKAFYSLKDSNEMLPLQYAGRARGIADWLVGINLTVASSKKFGSPKNIMSVGRVQTATLNMIIEREKSVSSHKKTPFWKVIGTVDGIIFEHNNGRFDTQNSAKGILSKVQNKSAVIENREDKIRTENAPLLYNSTALQSEAVKMFGFELKEVVEIMQKLYEKGFITYPRTNAEHLPEEMKNSVLTIITGLFNCDEYKKFTPKAIEPFTKRHFDTEKVTSHTAIITTDKMPSTDDLTVNERKIYDLVARSVLRLAFPKAEFSETFCQISADGEKFSAKISILTSQGWRILSPKSKMDKAQPVFNYQQGEVLDPVFSLSEGETEPPKRYTEASIITAMETCGKNFENEEVRQLMKAQKKGLGTDATRANILQNLFDKGYITKKGKSLCPTEKGTFLIEKLNIPSLKSPETTGEWERRLNNISEADENTAKNLYSEFIRDTITELCDCYAKIKALPTNQYMTDGDKKFVCPICKRKMFKGKYGYSCSGYSDTEKPCKFQINFEICGKTISETQAQMLCMSGRTGIIKGFVSAKGLEFDASLVVDVAQKKINFQFDHSRKNNKK